MYDETYAPVHCNWCGWSGDEADLDMNEHDEPTYCPVCGHSVCIADGLAKDVAPDNGYAIMPCDLDPFGECPKPEYTRDCAKCRGWTESEADKAVSDSLSDS